MDETSALDLRLLRAVRARLTHGYALAQELAAEGPDRATVYRRIGALRRAGLVSAHPVPGAGPQRQALSLTPAGEERLREELRDAMRLLTEAFHASLRSRRGSADGPARIEAPIVFASGSRVSGIELRIVASLAKVHPRQTHLVLPPGVDLARPPSGVAIVEGTWASLPFRDAYARSLFVNELPPARALPAAAREWARVLAPRGSLNVVAPAPLPRGVDPFVDLLADLRDELHPDSAGAPASGAVRRALARGFERIDERQEADQRVWTASRTKG
ncbi:MAG TPA: helix-turn-helix transcriptional regulator [Candidatus Thermoplasmatota archaeon]|nr:helix-turn-helix transcriptional regulator [Candidatus Thermoplasmatota archaeon]